MTSQFWNVMYVVASSFLFVAYLVILFQIIGDLFRDSETSGGKKALWVIGLLFIPVITALLYLVVRGRGMAERQRAVVQRAEAYYNELRGGSSVDQITRAKSLFDAGTIDADEFATLKRRALA